MGEAQSLLDSTIQENSNVDDATMVVVVVVVVVRAVPGGIVGTRLSENNHSICLTNVLIVHIPYTENILFNLFKIFRFLFDLALIISKISNHNFITRSLT